MGDKKQNQTQIEKLIAMANELEKRELAISRESKYLDELKVGARRAGTKPCRGQGGKARACVSCARGGGTQACFPGKAGQPAAACAAAHAAAPAAANAAARMAAPPPMQQPQPQQMQPQPMQPPVWQPAPPAAPKAAKPSAEIVTEINEILKSIFQDYSGSVHQISSQLSTVTAAMMCAAVTCVLENRGFDAKDAFLQEMQKMLQGGGLGEPCAKPAAPAPRPDVKPTPAPEPRPAAKPEPVYPSEPAYPSEPVYRPAPEPSVYRPVPAPAPEPELMFRPAPEAVYRPVQEPVYRPAPAPAPAAEPVVRQVPRPAPEPAPRAQYLDADEDDDETYSPLDSAAVKPRQSEDGVTRIGSVVEFQKLGEYGFRNDEKIVRDRACRRASSICRAASSTAAATCRRSGCRIRFWKSGLTRSTAANRLQTVHLGEKSALREIGEYAFAMCETLTFVHRAAACGDAGHQRVPLLLVA